MTAARRWLAVGFLAGLPAVLLAASSGQTSGTLHITRDTTLTEDHHGDITFDADDVGLDCAGHRILGSGQPAGILVDGRSGVEVRDCRASGFGNGFLVARSTRAVLEGNWASGNTVGFSVATGDQVRLHDNLADSNGQGFVISDTASSVFLENRSTNNDGDGLRWTDSDGNLIEENVAEGNRGSGFRLISSDGNELGMNVSRRNESGFVFEDSSGSSAYGNQASDNRRDGFVLIAERLSRLDRNTANDNIADGFHLERSFDVEFIDSVAVDNGGYDVGVEESWNITVRSRDARAGLRAEPGYPYLPELLSFLGLASTIWLGVYLVGQPKRTPVMWLTALTMWSIGGIFLDDFMGLNQPAAGFLQQIRDVLTWWPGARNILSQILLLGWISRYAVVLWYHATSLMRPAPMMRGRKALVLAGYGLATAAVLIQVTAPEQIVAGAVAFPIFAGGLLFYLGLSLANLVQRVRRAHNGFERRQFTLLMAATVVACLAGLVYLAGLSSGLAYSSAWTSLLLLAVLLLGYGVANYSAIVEGRTIRRHFIYSLVAVSLVTLLYFLVSYLSSVSFGVRTAAFAFVILLAVVTHSLAGNARAILDYFFVAPETRKFLRGLHRTSNNLTQEAQLDERLAVALDSLCTEIQASYGIVFLVSHGRARLATSYRWAGAKELPLQPEALATDDVTPVAPGTFAPPLDGAALLSPLYVETEHVGAVILGHPVNGTRFAPSEIDLAGYATDRMAEIIHFKRLEEDALVHMAQLAIPPPPALPEGEPSIQSVEGSLRRLHDLPYLGDSPLAQLKAARARLPAGRATTIDRGRAVHQILVEAMEKLKPEGQKPTLTSPREWHHYLILHEAYIADRPNRDVMAELYISEGTFNRRRREAIEAVTRMVREREEGERPTPG